MKNRASKKFATIVLATGLLFFCATMTQAAYKIEVGLPNLPAGSAVSDPGVYLKYLFIFGLSLAGFLAVGVIAWGGIQYMAAGTSLTNAQKGKEYILGALGGIALLLCSYLILATIDPTLTNLTPQVPPAVNVPAPQTPTTNYLGCAPNQIKDLASNQCQTCPTGQIADPILNRCEAQSTTYNAEKCAVKQTPTCTEKDCAPTGQCAAGEVWCAKKCLCVDQLNINVLCP